MKDQTTTITVGTRVDVKTAKLEETGVVISIASGWATVKLDIDGTTAKARIGNLIASAAREEKAPVVRVTREKLPLDQRKNGQVSAKYLSRYHRHNLGDGVMVVDNGDRVATELRGLELGEVYVCVAETTGATLNDLSQRYAGLNPGQQRMNLGNRLRGFYKRQEKLLDED